MKDLTRIGSDHCPLILDNGVSKRLVRRQFYFEKQWFLRDGFDSLLQQKWLQISERHPEGAYSLDKWHGNLSFLRQFLKGWGANVRGEYKRSKLNLMKQLKILDDIIENGDNGPTVMSERYIIEEKMEKLMEIGIILAKKRGEKSGFSRGTLIPLSSIWWTMVEEERNIFSLWKTMDNLCQILMEFRM